MASNRGSVVSAEEALVPRYSPKYLDDAMIEDGDGKYMLAHDHDRLVASLRVQLQAAETQRNELVVQLNNLKMLHQTVSDLGADDHHNLLRADATIQELEQRLAVAESIIHQTPTMDMMQRLAALEKELAAKDEYRVVWQVCEELKLGAGGCPDSLIINCVNELRERNKELEADLDIQKHGECHVSLSSDPDHAPDVGQEGSRA